MKVTNVKIFRCKTRWGQVATADIILDDVFSVADIRIIKNKTGGYELRYPVSQLSPNYEIRRICNPIERETQQAIEQAILDAYQQQLKERGNHYGG